MFITIIVINKRKRLTLGVEFVIYDNKVTFASALVGYEAKGQVVIKIDSIISPKMLHLNRQWHLQWYIDTSNYKRNK